MRQLNPAEIQEISGARFKFHFNVFNFISSVMVGAVVGGPFGIGVAVSIAVIAQGTGNLHEMYVDEFGNQ